MSANDKLEIPPDKQYEYLTAQLRYLDGKIFRSFALFIQIATAIIGGTFYLWLHFQNSGSDLRFAYITNGWLILVALGSIFLISNNLRSWKEHRKALCKRYKVDDLKNALWWTSEALACCGIMLSAIVFPFINPFRWSFPCCFVPWTVVLGFVAWFLPFWISKDRVP